MEINFSAPAGGTAFEDAAQKVTGKTARGVDRMRHWLFPTAASFGSANTFVLNTSVVINEIMYDPLPATPAPTKWVEKYNRSAANDDQRRSKLAH